MTKAAQFGRGTFTYIGRPEEVSEKMRELFSKIEQPVLHDLTIDWAGATVEAWPKRIPDVYGRSAGVRPRCCQEGAEYLHRSLVVRMLSIGDAENAACFSYPPSPHLSA